MGWVVFVLWCLVVFLSVWWVVGFSFFLGVVFLGMDVI